ncbi:hypothetical protein KDM87_12425 [Undibacterium sp. FT147W]|uniref:Transposase n=1 Tax=Undibacterium rivi TaxID=2828729 RepID=A0ABS5H4E9_9BURK|nr:hypothetical protein [Undibacterium rivi]MBR7793405.1 hypothetical protein [Undibacterium rivi]
MKIKHTPLFYSIYRQKTDILRRKKSRPSGRLLAFEPRAPASARWMMPGDLEELVLRLINQFVFRNPSALEGVKKVVPVDDF